MSTSSQSHSVLKYKFLTDTYTEDSVIALTHVREILEREMETSTETRDKDRHKLDLFDSIGMGFNQLADEYSELLGNIESLQWKLDEIDRQED